MRLGRIGRGSSRRFNRRDGRTLQRDPPSDSRNWPRLTQTRTRRNQPEPRLVDNFEPFRFFAAGEHQPMKLETATRTVTIDHAFDRLVLMRHNQNAETLTAFGASSSYVLSHVCCSHSIAPALSSSDSSLFDFGAIRKFLFGQAGAGDFRLERRYFGHAARILIEPAFRDFDEIQRFSVVAEHVVRAGKGNIDVGTRLAAESFLEQREGPLR